MRKFILDKLLEREKKAIECDQFNSDICASIHLHQHSINVGLFMMLGQPLAVLLPLSVYFYRAMDNN